MRVRTVAASLSVHENTISLLSSSYVEIGSTDDHPHSGIHVSLSEPSFRPQPTPIVSPRSTLESRGMEYTWRATKKIWFLESREHKH